VESHSVWCLEESTLKILVPDTTTTHLALTSAHLGDLPINLITIHLSSDYS